MAVSIRDILTDLDRKDLADQFWDLIRAANLPFTEFQSISPVRGIVEVFVDFFANIWNTGALPFMRAPFLELATKDVLTLVCLALYNTPRQLAEFATGPVVVYNTSKTAFYSFVGDDLRVRNPATGKTYKNLAPTPGNEALGPWSGSGPFPFVTLTFRADEVGYASTSAAGTITEVLDTFPGLTCTNPIALVGADEERDEDLRVRARASVGPFSPMGPRLAYEYAARAAVRLDGSPVVVNRTRILTPPGDGTLRMVIASSTGPVDPGDVALVLEKARAVAEPIGITVSVESAISKIAAFNYTAYVRSSNLAINGLVNAALIDWFRSAPIGGWKKSVAQPIGKIYARETESIISSVDPGIFLAEIGIGDLDVADNEVPVLGTVGSTVQVVNY